MQYQKYSQWQDNENHHSPQETGAVSTIWNYTEQAKTKETDETTRK